MATEQTPTKVRVTLGRLSFPRIWTPGVVNEGDEPKFSCHVLLGDTADNNVKRVARMVDQVGKTKWPQAWADEKFRRRIKAKSCLRDQGEKDNYDGYEEGFYFVSSSAKAADRPDIRDRDGMTPLVEADGRPYSGCYVDAVFQVWAQDNNYGKRVNAQLVALQFRKDGDRFSGAGVKASDDDFEDYSEGEESEEFEEVDDDIMG